MTKMQLKSANIPGKISIIQNFFLYSTNKNQMIAHEGVSYVLFKSAMCYHIKCIRVRQSFLLQCDGYINSYMHCVNEVVKICDEY